MDRIVSSEDPVRRRLDTMTHKDRADNGLVLTKRGNFFSRVLSQI